MRREQRPVVHIYRYGKRRSHNLYKGGDYNVQQVTFIYEDMAPPTCHNRNSVWSFASSSSLRLLSAASFPLISSSPLRFHNSLTNIGTYNRGFIFRPFAEQVLRRITCTEVRKRGNSLLIRVRKSYVMMHIHI